MVTFSAMCLNCLGLCVCYFLCLHIMAWDEWLIWLIKVCFKDTTLNIIWILVHLILICVIHGKKRINFTLFFKAAWGVSLPVCVCACVFVNIYLSKHFTLTKSVTEKNLHMLQRKREKKARSSILFVIFLLHRF